MKKLLRGAYEKIAYQDAEERSSRPKNRDGKKINPV